MRKSGMLRIIAGSKAAEDTEYKDFLTQTGFDYTRDLDGVAATFRGDQTFFAARGRFDWPKLIGYAKQRGGTCKGSYCVVDGSRPGRRISFYRPAGDVLALAVSPDDMAAYQIARNAGGVSPFSPDAPVWVLVPSAVFDELTALPAGTKAFALALKKADRALFSITPDGDHLKLTASVTCRNEEAASDLLIELEKTTDLLRSMLAEQHLTANPKDLSGVLVAGSFRRVERKVLAEWPLQRPFVESIGGSD
jgi:hypothetical protein